MVLCDKIKKHIYVPIAICGIAVTTLAMGRVEHADAMQHLIASVDDVTQHVQQTAGYAEAASNPIIVLTECFKCSQRIF